MILLAWGFHPVRLQAHGQLTAYYSLHRGLCVFICKKWSYSFGGNMVTNGLLHSLCRRANVQNVSFETLNGSQFTLSTQLVIVTPFIHLKFQDRQFP